MLAKNCEFSNADEEIKTQVIQCCASSRLCRKALREPDLTLEKLLDHGRTLELSEMQATGIERGTTAAVNVLDRKAVDKHPKGSRVSKQQHYNTSCRNCGGKYPHEGVCPAKNKECRACGKMNHFARQCCSTPNETNTKRPQQKAKQHPKNVHHTSKAAPEKNTEHLF